MGHTDHRAVTAMDALAAVGTANASGRTRVIRADRLTDAQIFVLRMGLTQRLVRRGGRASAPTINRLADLGYVTIKWEMVGRRKVLVGFMITERGYRKVAS